MTADAAADTTADTAKTKKKNKSGMAMRRVRLPKDRNVRILSAACVVLFVATAVLAFFYVMQQQASSASTDATTAATADVPKVLSYTFSSISTDMSQAEAVSTPTFRSQYEKDMNGLKAEAVQNQVVTSTAVSNSSIISSSANKVTLLMFLSMQTKTKARAESVLNDNAVRVTMRKEGGRWLVDDVTPHP